MVKWSLLVTSDHYFKVYSIINGPLLEILDCYGINNYNLTDIVATIPIATYLSTEFNWTKMNWIGNIRLQIVD